jgi:hypothetical protein
METDVVDSVTREISRAEFVEWFAQVGLDANDVTAIQVERDVITADLFVRSSEGSPYLTRDGHDVMLRRVYIFVKDPRGVSI